MMATSPERKLAIAAEALNELAHKWRLRARRLRRRGRRETAAMLTAGARELEETVRGKRK